MFYRFKNNYYRTRIVLLMLIIFCFTNAVSAQIKPDTAATKAKTDTPVTQVKHPNFPQRLQAFDEQVLIDFALHRNPEKTKFLRAVSNSYLYGNIGVPAGLLVGGIIANDKGMRQNALYIGSSTIINALVTTLIKTIVKRPRPYVHNVKIIAVYQAGYYSFPSGHTSSTFATATALSMAYPKWYVIAPAFLWSGTVAYSRMYLGVHYPTDVTAGAILGAGTAVGMSFMRR
jgi:membrane-associated phospholipid phosphatase